MQRVQHTKIKHVDKSEIWTAIKTDGFLAHLTGWSKPEKIYHETKNVRLIWTKGK